MDWSKVDAALAGALADAGDPGERLLPVFVHVDAGRADPSILADLDVQPEGGGVRTGMVSPDGVDHLTDQPWVTRVQLSGPLRLLGDA